MYKITKNYKFLIEQNLTIQAFSNTNKQKLFPFTKYYEGYYGVFEK